MTEVVRQLTADAAEQLPNAQNSAARAKKTIWLVFVVALVLGVGLRYERTIKVLDDLAPLVEKINATLVENPTTSVAAIQEVLTEQLSAGKGETHAALARVLAYHFKQQPDLPEKKRRNRFLKEFQGALLSNWLVLSLIHLGLLSIFPGSFAIAINKALARIKKQAGTVAGAPTTFREIVIYHRDRAFLEEEGKPMIWRRFAVFVLFSLSITYLMAPAGLYASTVGELLTIYPIPGDTTQPFWFAEFEHVQPFVLGLAGFLIYSLVTFARGVTIGELGNRLFLALWNRGITVVILSLVLTAMQFDSAVLNALIFIAGVFPQTGIQAIAKVAQRGAEQAAALNPTGLSALPQIDSFGESSLRSLGIFNVADLASADLDELLKLSPIQPPVLLKAVDRALLLDTFDTLHEKLAEIPVYNASELVLYVEGRDAYMDRWNAFNRQPPRHLAPQLDDAEKQSRLNKVNAALEVVAISTQVDKLKQNYNLQFIIDNALCYADA